MASLIVAVDDDRRKAQERAATFLGTTYSQDFGDSIDRVAVTGTLDRVVERLAAFVDAGARHSVLLPCRDPNARGTEALPPWLPDLVRDLRAG